MTLFAHESSSSLIETFPRSGSTVVLSNLALENLGITTSYSTNNVNLLREKLLPQKQISEYKEKVLLVRSPLERLESFYLTKLVAGEPKSVVAIGELIYKRTLRYPILFYKSLKGFFDSESDHLLTLIAKKQNFERAVVEDLLNIKNLIKSLTFHDMMSLLMKYGMPRDAHVFPQFAMKTFRICEYNHIFNLENFSTFKSWYDSTTGSRFNLKFNHTQPNNRLRMKSLMALLR